MPKLTYVLISVCTLLGAIIGLEVEHALSSGAAARETPAPARIAGNDPRPSAASFEPPPLSTFGTIVARPLFAPSRRPPLPAEAAVPAPPSVRPEPGQLRLRGVAVAGGHRGALIERSTTGELLRVAENQSIDGWLVASITPRDVVLEQGGVRDRLQLRDDLGPPAAHQRAEPPGEPGADDVWEDVDLEELEGGNLEAIPDSALRQ
jgi:general secretion pathway protein N